MSINHVLFFNLFVPLFVGLFFLLYFVYFVLANPSKAASYRYFVVFLMGFCVFIAGRALQVALGPHPLPLIIVNIRVFMLCAVVSPVAMLTASGFRRRDVRRREIAVVGACVVLGLVYVVFNTLGTPGSAVLYDSGGLVVYDNLTPSMAPPFYAREVTLAVQVLIGLMLFLFSAEKLVRLKLGNSLGDYLSDKNFLINLGIAIFALSFIAGSLARQWWIYYAASVASALFVGASVLKDIKEIHAYYEKLVPFVKEDLVHNVAFKDSTKMRIREMLRMLGKKPSMDTFVMARIKTRSEDLSADLAQLEAALGAFNRHLGLRFDEADYMLLPLSNDRLGITLSLLKAPPGQRFGLLEALEAAQAELAAKASCSIKIGIGRSYADIDDLRLSYAEARSAQEYAEQRPGSDVVHVDNIIGSEAKRGAYPVGEKERLLAAAKSGDLAESRVALEDFLEKFRTFIEGNPGILKVRLYELAGSLIDSAILGGGDEKKLNDLVGKCFDDINLIKDFKTAESWLTGVVEEIAANIGGVHESRSRTLIEHAKRCIEKNYKSKLSYKDVAKEIFISPSYFLNLFKKETGLTFTDYLTEVRIREAKVLLRTSGLNVTEIAYELGFNNSNYFSNLFKKSAGVSALEYRKLNAPAPAPRAAPR